MNGLGNTNRARTTKPLPKPPILYAQILILAAITLTVLEGAVRKWLYPSAPLSYVAYFSKDLIFALVLFFPPRPPGLGARILSPWLTWSIVLLSFGSILSAISGVNSVGALLTIRSTLLLPLLAFVALSRFPQLKLSTAVWWVGLLVLANFLLSVAQYSLPPSHLLNRYAADADHIVYEKSGVRATGTFAYITGLSILSTVGVWAGTVLVNTAISMRSVIAGWLVILTALGCALTSMSRAPLIGNLIMLTVWMLFTFTPFQFVRNLSALILLVCGLSVAGLLPMSGRLVAGMAERHAAAGDTFVERSFDPVTQIINAVSVSALGSGLGLEQVGGNVYKTGTMSFTTFEYQFPRLILETGVLGLLGFLICCTGALYTLQRLKTRSNRAIMLSTQMVLGYNFYVNVAFNHTASSFVWIIFVITVCALQGEASQKRHGD